MSVFLVHGFLGQPEDWNPVCQVLQEKELDLKIHVPHLWRDLPPSQFSSLEVAGEALASLCPGENLTVVGYSLGGRILSHWPKSQWSRIKKMILISAHGGLDSEKEKRERQESDQKWAALFLKEPWNQVVASWNDQPVFAGDRSRPLRQEKDFDRLELSNALKHWSLSSQKNIFSELKSACFPIHYVTGEMDSKFTQYAQTLKAQFQDWHFHSLPAGHSSHLSHPREVAEMI